MLDYFRERGHRSDLDAIGSGVNSFQLRDPAQIDHHLRLLDAVLEPVEAVHASSEHPCVAPVMLKQLLRIANRAWLQQLKCRHNISNYGHVFSFRVWTKCVPSKDVAWAVRIPAKSRWYPR